MRFTRWPCSSADSPLGDTHVWGGPQPDASSRSPLAVSGPFSPGPPLSQFVGPSSPSVTNSPPSTWSSPPRGEPRRSAPAPSLLSLARPLLSSMSRLLLVGPRSQLATGIFLWREGGHHFHPGHDEYHKPAALGHYASHGAGSAGSPAHVGRYREH